MLEGLSVKSERCYVNHHALIDRGKIQDKYKEIHNKPIEHYILTAAVLKGIAAVFISTGLYISLLNTLFSIMLNSTCLFLAIISYSFSFERNVDKSYHRCRQIHLKLVPQQNLKIFFQTVQVLHSLTSIIGISPEARGGERNESSRPQGGINPYFARP